MNIIENWRIKYCDPGSQRPMEMAAPGLDDRYWIAAKVPGDVHSTLLEHRIIDDPYFGHNDQKALWVEDKEWWYRGSFEHRPEAASPKGAGSEPEPVAGGGVLPERFDLVFEGLDTFATVYFNGHEIGRSANMFLGQSFDVAALLKPGKNVIAVRFDPVSAHNREVEQFEWSSYTKERPWIRKAAMNFGWDWGLRLLTCGIWGPVRIERRRGAFIDGVFARTVELAGASGGAATSRDLRPNGEAQSARVRVDAEISLVGTTGRETLAGPGYRMEIRLLDADREIARADASSGVTLDFGAELLVPSPKLWWTHELGAPHLYELELVLFAGDVEIDRHQKPFGIRTIELRLKDAEGANSFAFFLNGVRIWAKGANWIPADNMIGAIPEERYRRLITLVRQGNMNMLRVWAGGIYEKDIFYDECDRQGILVWQDMCFANALFPDFNREFMGSVREELEYNVRRLRNHASLALWCGNNEIDWLYDMRSSSGEIKGDFFGRRIYHELIPSVLKAHDESRPYWPSSPWGGDDVNDPDEGDRHNWQVWHGSVYPRKSGEMPRLDYSVEGVSFKNYAKDMALFSSEFGMHASANRRTLESRLPPGEFFWGSPEMAYRNKDTNHQKGILLMEGFTGRPKTIDEYLNFSMLTQAEGLKFGVEHYRRIGRRNSGALIWQLNDSWPGTSWSIIDYDLLPKASWYYGRKFFAPILLSLEIEAGRGVSLWAINDTRSVFEDTVSVEVSGFDGLSKAKRSFSVRVEANGVYKVADLTESEILSGADPSTVFVRVAAQSNPALEGFYYLRDHKDLALPRTRLHVGSVDNDSLTIRSDGGLSRMVRLDSTQEGVSFSDNYFDLVPGGTREIGVLNAGVLPLSLEGITVSAINADETRVQ